ncbi:MAG: coproporphyrinogen III oxidase family protein [Spirochaetes bacterium]|nr:coproporphyrinogen III oxidase family protein [Spirochaetota bacterium]
MKYGIYIHIPFCLDKCDYCGFYSEVTPRRADDAAVPRLFIRNLQEEIIERLRGRGRPEADTVYIGGGTPSLLEQGQVASLMETLRVCFDLAVDAEISMEINPRDCTIERLAAYRDAGVNRTVLGVQTLSERLHHIIGRSCLYAGEAEIAHFFDLPGIIHCADLIAGIPSQEEDELVRDIDALAGFGADHISLYLLSIEAGTPLSRRIAMDEALEEAQGRLFMAARARLQSHGYDHYEISNYARGGRVSRHNLKYWNFEPYFGFGPGAHSFVEGERYTNDVTVSGYCGSGPVAPTRDIRGPHSPCVEYLMTGLRLLGGLSIGGMERRLGISVPPAVMARINEAATMGMIKVDGRDDGMTVRLSERGIIMSDSVIYSLVQDLL